MVSVTKIASDPQLPQLKQVTDPEFMRTHLQTRLPGFAEQRLRINRLRVTQFNHKPGKSCFVVYRTSITDLQNDCTGKQIFTGVLNPNTDLHQRFEAANSGKLAETNFGPPLFALPELEMLLWGFPNDTTLPQLEHLMNRERITSCINEQRELFNLPASVRVKKVDAEVIKYVPFDRCTLCYTLTLANGKHRKIYGKTIAKSGLSARVYKITRAFWASPVCQSGKMLIPQPLYYSADFDAVFTTGFNGRHADDVVETLDLNTAAAAIGEGIAGIHRVEIPGLETQSDAAFFEKMSPVPDMLGGVDTRCQRQAESILNELHKRLPKLTPVTHTTIHGGFRLSQLLAASGKYTLLDYDDVCKANPLTDVGSFAAHLWYLALKGKIGKTDSLQAIRTFCSAYDRHAEFDLPADNLTWHTAAQLVGKQAKKCAKQRKRNYRSIIEQLLGAADKLLSREITLI